MEEAQEAVEANVTEDAEVENAPSEYVREENALREE